MKRRTWFILIAVVVVLVGGFIGFRVYGQAQAVMEEMGDLQTEDVGYGSLVATVGGTGIVRANQTANLSWQASGSVGSVDVIVGNSVNEGDVLATISQTSLPQNIILAQADIVAAEQALEDFYDGFSDLALAQTAQAVATAQSEVDDAQKYLDNLNSPARQTDIDQAEANVVLTQDKLDKAKEDFDPYAGKNNSVTKAARQSALAQAQADFDNASRYYNALKGTASALDIAQGEANLALAKANLTDALERYEEIQAGAQAEDIAAAEARIAAAQATLDMALVDAPFDGTITRVDPKIGDQVSTGSPAFRLDDLSHLLVDVQVSEVDINRIQIEQDVSLTFDAILAAEYTGRVTEVSLVGESVQGIVNFTVTVELLDADELVRPGMTAAVNIVVSQLENVLLVPNRAVRVTEGMRVVFITKNGQFEPIEIVLGASSDVYSEVIDGELVEGMKIILNPPFYLTNNPFADGPPGR